MLLKLWDFICCIGILLFCRCKGTLQYHTSDYSVCLRCYRKKRKKGFLMFDTLTRDDVYFIILFLYVGMFYIDYRVKMGGMKKALSRLSAELENMKVTLKFESERATLLEGIIRNIPNVFIDKTTLTESKETTNVITAKRESNSCQ